MKLTYIFMAMVPAVIGLIATIIKDWIDKMKIANEETVSSAMKKCDEIARSFEQIDGNAILDDYVKKWQDGVMMRLSSVTEPMKTVLMYHGEEISLEEARLLQKDGIGLVADWAKPLSTVKLSDHSHRCKCAYCDTLNDHEIGVCDRCGAPLEG